MKCAEAVGYYVCRLHRRPMKQNKGVGNMHPKLWFQARTQQKYAPMTGY